jgi:hypothetical protein
MKVETMKLTLSRAFDASTIASVHDGAVVPKAAAVKHASR